MTNGYIHKAMIKQMQQNYSTFLGDTPKQRMYNFKLIKKFLDDGLSLAKISEKFGCSFQNISRWLLEHYDFCATDYKEQIKVNKQKDKTISNFAQKIIELKELCKLKQNKIRALQVYNCQLRKEIDNLKLKLRERNLSEKEIDDLLERLI